MARFHHSKAQHIHCVRVSDPLHDIFMQACFNIVRLISGNESDQIDIRVKTSGLFYRVSSYVNDDFSSETFVKYVENELEELASLASQFEAAGNNARTIAKTISLMIDRGTNYKRAAILNSKVSSELGSSMALVERGHKWRTLDISSKSFSDKEWATMFFDSRDYKPLDMVLLPMSPNLLAKKLQKELIFCAGAEFLVIFIYSREKLKLPEIPLFIASSESGDSPLIPTPKITFENFNAESNTTDVMDDEEIELDFDSYTPRSDRVLRLLLITNEEVLLQPCDYVWCDDQGHLSHIPSVELVEGMRLLLRSEHQLEKPEAYLDRSEAWRTPLRSIVNLGISCDLVSRNIEHRSGISVNSRMIRSWIDGSVLGPEDRSVFFQLVEELKLRDFLDMSVRSSEIQSWWDDLERARFAQTTKGVKNRSEALKEAERVLIEDVDESSSDGSLFEYSEILVIERAWVDFGQLESLGVSNRRNVRVFS